MIQNTLLRLNIDICNTGEIFKDVFDSFRLHSLKRVSNHTKRVVRESEYIARKYDFDIELARLAALLHDISAVIKNDLRIDACRYSNVLMIKEEQTFPMLTHQKLSREIAQGIYKITNMEVLSAIECHTTLKKEPSKLDLILFISDKLEWDQDGKPPYYNEMKRELDISLEKSALIYINYLLNRKTKLKVVHPWLLEARDYLKSKI